MFCSQCARRLPAEAAFCSTCGGSAVTAAEQPWAIRITTPVVAPATPTRTASRPARVPAPALPWRTLVPFREWFSDLTWLRSRWGVFAAFAAAPFVLLQLTGDTDDITHVAWGFATYFGVMWLLVIHQLVKPERPRLRLMAATTLTTATAGVALAVALEELLGAEEEGLLRMVFAVGYPEEIAKALPVVAFLLLRKVPATPRLYLFTGAVSGLVFGVVEAVGYSDLYASFVDSDSASSYTSITVWRLLTDGLFHACFAGTAAFFIGLAHWYRQAAVRLIAAGVSLAALLHGLYDHFAGGWIGTALAVLSVLCFVGYARTGDRIALALTAPTPDGGPRA